MKDLNRILVACDGLRGLDAALDKAAYLEHYSGCEIDVLDVVWDEVEEEAVIDEIKSAIREGLLAGEHRELLAATSDTKTRVATLVEEVVWHKHAEQPILKHVKERNIDLLIVHSSKHGFSDHLLTPLDWKLARQSPCPVLVCRSQTEWKDDAKLLAAVDTGNLDQKDLNQEIVETGMYFASLLDAELHLISVYPSLDFRFDPKRGPVVFDELRTAMHDVRETGMQELLCNSPRTVTHVTEGKANLEISKLAGELNASITLIGTHARHGVGKWVFGNTSESTLSRLDCDLLIVRER